MFSGQLIIVVDLSHAQPRRVSFRSLETAIKRSVRLRALSNCEVATSYLQIFIVLPLEQTFYFYLYHGFSSRMRDVGCPLRRRRPSSMVIRRGRNRMIKRRGRGRCTRWDATYVLDYSCFQARFLPRYQYLDTY